ncbi:DUF4157 domain-containing protein [Nitrosospira sp. NRS527]|uniref:eCIS core domain-containing protein n=1 Tax=Nitrosospira sp. NRS527 TaxID=155925 RepID=UPI001BCAA1C1|nr:DUF4157 domain-containing protein [Nitrosospira sp. NRS527]
MSAPGDTPEREANQFADQMQEPAEATRQTAMPRAAPQPAPDTHGLFANTGTPLPNDTRERFEPQLDIDLRGVRVHTDPDTARTARHLHAEAFTLGHDIGFAARRYAPESSTGQHLLAHELTHVAQQQRGADSGTAYRAVSPDYDTIESNLTYGIIDWAITDVEAHEVLTLLDGLSDRDLADTVAAMDRDGLVDRLLDNLTREDEERYAVLIGRINRHRSVSHSANWIIDRLSYGFFDWAITDDDAHRALTSLMGLESQELRTVVGRMINEGVFNRLEEELPDEDRVQFPAFLARLRAIRDEFHALVAAHTTFLRSRPEASNSPSGAGAVIRGTVSSTGYGGSRATWPDLSDDVQAEWRRRAAVVIANVIESVRGTDLEPILARGRLVFNPEESERLNAYAYVVGANQLYFGRSWVEDAEGNPRSVWQSIAHELGGHEEFGATWSWEIMRATLAGLTPEERREAVSGVNSVYSAYGYLETEIYAELRELYHRIPTSGGDRPDFDVPQQLRRIRDAFGPDVGRQIVLRLYYRVLGDPRISDSARAILYNAVQSVFGMFPYADTLMP